MEAEIRWVEEATSTNSLLAASAADAVHGYVIAARRQTAGRGQRGNSWESAPGMNLTFSMLLRPTAIEAASQFRLSMIISLGVCEALDRAAGRHDAFSVKWPNDIYYGDKKVCGILIENSLAGRRIERSIAGIGVNVNQLRFESDAPNPVSLVHIIGRETALEPLLADICRSIIDRYEDYRNNHDFERLVGEYRRRLWRKTGLHKWHDCLKDEKVVASVENVADDGILTLRLDDGSLRSYAFKEVAAVL